MGVDFLYRVRKYFKRRWDRGRNDLCQPTLFTKTPSQRPRKVLLTAFDNGAVPEGDTIVLRASGQALVAYSKQNTPLGNCAEPPAELLAKILESGGAAVGTICKVHPLSSRFDVEVN